MVKNFTQFTKFCFCFFISLYLNLFFNNLTLHSAGYPNARVTVNSNSTPGYIMLGSSIINAGFYDNYGIAIDTSVAKWENLKPGLDFKIHNNGKITYFDQNKMKFVVLNSQLNIIDSLECVNGVLTDFHDIQFASNGNVLLIGVKYKNVNMSELVTGGQENATVKGFVLQELNLQKELVWEWSTFDYFKITDAVSSIDLTANSISYSHINSAIYDNDGNIIISSRHMDELTKINRQTGQIMWRMGGSSCKNNTFIFIDDKDETNYTGFSHQHTPIRLSNGNLMLFDNGNMKGNQYSRAVEYEIDEVNQIARKVWEFRLYPPYYAAQMGSVSELYNGNILISWWNRIIEVTKSKSVLFDMSFDAEFTYRSQKLPYNMDFYEHFVNSKKTYSFNSSSNKTNVDLNIDTLSGIGIVSVIRHKYAPKFATFTLNQTPTLLPIRYVIQKSDEISNLKANFIVDSRTIPNFKLADSVKIFYRNKENGSAFTLLNTTYKNNTIEARIPGAGEIVLGSIPKFSNPIIKFPIDKSVGVPFSNTQITWAKVSDATNYRIQISKDSLFNNNIADTLIGNTDILNVKLESFTKYFLRIKSIGNNIESLWSNSRTFETLIESPLHIYPKNNSYSISLNDTLKWGKVLGAKKYNVQISNDMNFGKMNIIYEQVVDSNFIVLKNLLNSSRYYWKVKALRDTTGSAYSKSTYFNTKLYTLILNSPRNKEMYFKLDSLLKWERTEINLLYHLQVAEDKNFNKIIINELALTSTQYNSRKLLYNKEYFWRVRSYEINNTSDWSEVRQFKTELQQPTLLLPKYEQKDVDINTVLAWNKVSGAIYYNIQLSKIFDFQEIILDTVIYNENNHLNSFALKNLDLSTIYFWRIKAFNDFGETNYSVPYNFTTKGKINITEPKLLKPLNNYVFTQNEIQFEWDTINIAESYRLQISQDENFNNLDLDTNISVNKFDFVIKNDKQKYYWRVQLISKYGNSDWSSIRSFFIESENNILPKPKLIIPFNNSKELSTKPYFDWEKNENAKYYKLIISTNENFNEDNITIDTLFDDYLDLSSIQFIELKSNAVYYWKVQSFNDNQLSQWSEVWNFKTKDDITSINNEIKNSENLSELQNDFLLVYPNPAGNEINVLLNQIQNETQNQNNLHYEIINIEGNTILKYNLENKDNNFKINLTNMNSGVYYLRIKINESKFITSSFVVNK